MGTSRLEGGVGGWRLQTGLDGMDTCGPWTSRVYNSSIYRRGTVLETD